ncbi:MAG: VCBS repeat-containing protein, partial [Planctomycetes bacterium]|nr:VCBS repeat-containing protein [Planctomycetota bacterium]
AATYGDEQNHVQLGAKNLSILGAGVGATIIKADSSTDLVLPAGSLTSPTMEVHRCSMAFNLGTGRTYLRDLTLDQGFSLPSTGRANCLWVGGGADVECDNVEFTNARANPISGAQRPVAINIRGENAGDQCVVTLRHCLVHEYGKNGIVAFYNAHLSMDDCRVEGYNEAILGLAAQNGIQATFGASCELRRCTVNDNWYTPYTVTATGFLGFDPGSPVIIEDCNFGNCQSAIYVFSGEATPLALTGSITRNHVHAAYNAVVVSNVQGLSIAGNSFGINRAGVADDAWDDAGSNTWDGNYFSSLSAPGAYAIPGGGGSTDSNAQPFMAGFGADVVTAMTAGCSPVDMAVGQFNGDSQPDFAALCVNGSPSVDVGLNSGGSFTVTNVPFGVSAGNPVAICTGEFNGAPGLDIAVLTANIPPALTENKVYVFANNGSGGFSLLHTHTIAGGTTPSGIAAGDFTGDGVADIAVSDSGSAGFIAGSATVLANNGTGTTFTASSLAGGFTAACRDVTVGDLVGSGALDIAVVEGDATTGKVHVFVGNGTGGFTPNAGSPLACELNPQQVLAADVEGDGDTDLLVTATRDAFGLGDGGLNVFANDGGTFTRELHRVDRGPTHIAAGDFGNDDDPDTVRRDVALVNPIAGSISVLGQWSDAGAGTGGIAAAGVLPTGIAIADADGDTFGDLFYCDAAAGAVVVRLGVAEARVDIYGTGTPGRAGRVPDLYAIGVPALPTQPSPTFGLGLRNARPFSVAVIAAGLAPAAQTSINDLLLDIGSIGATWIVVTTVSGTAAVPLPFPGSPSYFGLPFYFQAGVFDSDGSDAFILGGPFPGLAMTNGLKVRIGQ